MKKLAALLLLLAALLAVLLSAGYYFRDSLPGLQGLVGGKAPETKSARRRCTRRA